MKCAIPRATINADDYMLCGASARRDKMDFAPRADGREAVMHATSMMVVPSWH
jgi:hypothetical protein